MCHLPSLAMPKQRRLPRQRRRQRENPMPPREEAYRRERKDHLREEQLRLQPDRAIPPRAAELWTEQRPRAARQPRTGMQKAVP